MNEDIFLTVQQIADITKVTRQGVHYHIRRGDFGEPFRGPVPPGKTSDLAATGRPPMIWLKLADVLDHYRASADAFRKIESVLTI